VSDSSPRRWSAADRWNDFWFQEVPRSAYAILRIVFGMLGLVTVLGLLPVSTFWYPDGLAPLPGDDVGLRAALLERGLGGVAGWSLFAALTAAFTLMTVGYQSRWVVPLCFLGTIVLRHWNPLPLSGAYSAFAGVLFCLAWADCSGAPSFDARRRDVSPANDTEPIWPMRLIRIQIALIYLNSGLWKLFGDEWQNGSAIHYVLQINNFHRFPFEVPAGLEAMLAFTTYLTLFWEIAFVFMLFNRWTRILALWLGVALHGGMWLTLDLGPFSWVMIASYLAFLEPATLDRAARAVRFGAAIRAGDEPALTRRV
jgi:hypothetical protein